MKCLEIAMSNRNRLGLPLVAASVVLATLILAGCRGSGPEGGIPLADRPNIVLITVDSLRPDHLGCYGHDRPTSPNLDALAAQGTRYDHAFATTSWTLESHASIFTGLYGGANRVLTPEDRLADPYTTLAEGLSDAGYQTAGVASGPFLRKKHNLNQGFAHYDDSVAAPTEEDSHRDITNPKMRAAVDRFFDDTRESGRPFFLFAYYWDPHYDYIPPPPYDARFVPEGAEPIQNVDFNPLGPTRHTITPPQLAWLKSQYDGEIACNDATLGALFDRLKAEGLWDNTLIIVTSDHGEAFLEHGVLGHKNDLHVEEVKVPLIVKYPHQKEGKADPRLVSLVDLYPTALEVAGVEPDGPVQGLSLLDPAPEGRVIFQDLLSLWAYAQGPGSRPLTRFQAWSAARDDTFSLLAIQGRTPQLFDARSDPGEQTPLGPEDHPADATRLQAALDDWFGSMQAIAQQVGKGKAPSRANLDDKERARLRSLGYLR